jgi:hypothetical protein
MTAVFLSLVWSLSLSRPLYSEAGCRSAGLGSNANNNGDSVGEGFSILRFLEWDGTKWLDQPTSAFLPNESWEHCSVYEPNPIYPDGKWKM